MNASSPAWSAKAKRVPEEINSQLVGTFPSIVIGDDGIETCAFFVRATRQELSNANLKKKTGNCLVRPQFIKTPHGPLVVAYCKVGSNNPQGSEPFISETAIFPRLPSTPTHQKICEMLQSRSEAYIIVCNENGKCIFNSKAEIMDQWRDVLAENMKAFDEGKQIADEKTAIMSLYWYQERYNPSSKLFEIAH